MSENKLLCEVCESDDESQLIAVMYPGAETQLNLYCLDCLSKSHNQKEVRDCRLFKLGKELTLSEIKFNKNL